MELFLKYLGEVMDFASHWPDFMCVIAGMAAGNAQTIALERYFLPKVIDPEAIRRQQGFTFLFCWFASALQSTILWSIWDPADPFLARFACSAIICSAARLIYPPLASALTKAFPMISSAWRKTP